MILPFGQQTNRPSSVEPLARRLPEGTILEIGSGPSVHVLPLSELHL
jgi:hypothetical protein